MDDPSLCCKKLGIKSRKIISHSEVIVYLSIHGLSSDPAGGDVMRGSVVSEPSSYNKQKTVMPV